MAVEQASEVRLAQPAVDVPADLDAHGFGDERGSAAPCGEIDLTEAALPEQAFDLVLEPRLRADDDLPDLEEIAAMIGATP